jgi:hypothetical protein
MSALVPCYVPPEWTGQIQSKLVHTIPLLHCLLIFGSRIKAKLRNGELIIPGDQWPAFLYAGENFDREDPWKGLFKNSILVAVS